MMRRGQRTIVGLLASAARSRPEISFRLRFWDGEETSLGSATPGFVLTFATASALRATLLKGFLGFGEAYMRGEIEVEGDWDRLFALALGSDLERARPRGAAALAWLLGRWRRRASRRGARRNAACHYDLGNDFFRLWLDEGMSYSCAYFRTPGLTIDEAQEAKLELICRKLRLRPGQTLLDVGCGWGALVIHAARAHGVRAVGCTLSTEQAELARQRVHDAGLDERVEVRLQDYRDVSGSFDRWVSVGMAEHVGKAFFSPFATSIARLLRPGGVGLLHLIGKDRVSPGDPWTLTYIFPGSYIPALPEVTGHLGRHGLVVADVENLRLHYARTLECWRQRFEARAAEVEAMLGRRFVRMWRLFLTSSAAGFRYGDTRLYQIVFSNGPSNELPETREDLYREPPGELPEN
jgi:cyclopropane-fatty-acyl-phospholipid synthase